MGHGNDGSEMQNFYAIPATATDNRPVLSGHVNGDKITKNVHGIRTTATDHQLETNNVYEFQSTADGDWFAFIDHVNTDQETHNVSDIQSMTSDEGSTSMPTPQLTATDLVSVTIVIMQNTRIISKLVVFSDLQVQKTDMNSSNSSGKRWSYLGDFKRDDMNDQNLARKYFDIANQYVEKLKLTIKDLQKSIRLSSKMDDKQEKLKPALLKIIQEK
jgi:hypothetical protein